MSEYSLTNTETENTEVQHFQLFSISAHLALSAGTLPPLNCGHVCQQSLSSARGKIVIFKVDQQQVQ